MNNNFQITEAELELADKYLSGTLNAEEKELFEKRLQTDAGWAATFKQIQLLSLGIQEASLEEKLQEWNHRESQAPVRPITWFKKLAAACIIIVLCSAIGWLFFKDTAEEKLYAAFYRADPGLATNMSVSNNYEFERAMVDYKTGHYKAALERWNKLSAANPASDTLHYFIAAAQLGNADTEAAISSFNKVIRQQSSVFKSEAYWFKGLALLKQQKKQEAIQSIRQSDHPQKAALLLKLNN